MTQLDDETRREASSLPISDSNYAQHLRHSPYLRVILNIIMVGAWSCGIGIYWEAITSVAYAAHLAFHLTSILSALLGAVSAVSSTFFFGRRRAIITHLIPIIPAYVLTPLYQGAHWCDLSSRFLGHFAIGGYITVACIYIGEVCLSCKRTSNYTIFAICIWMGYICYDLLFRVHPLAALAATIFPVVFLILSCIYLPESPYYVYQIQEKELAAEIIHFLRCGPLVYKEMEYLSMVRHVFSYERAFWVHSRRWQLYDRAVTILLLIFFTTFGGIALIITHLDAFCFIFPESLDEEFAYSGHDRISICRIIQFVLVFICALIGSIIFAKRGDGWGRRWLMVISFSGTTLALVLILVEIILGVNWFLLQVGMLLFVFFYFMGQAEMPFLLIGEMYPFMLKCCYTAYGVACFFVMLILAFIVTHVFYYAIGLLIIFHILISVIAIIFAVLLIPKHRCFSLEAVEKFMDVSNTAYLMVTFTKDTPEQPSCCRMAKWLNEEAEKSCGTQGKCTDS